MPSHDNSWLIRYARKVCSAEDAIRAIEPGRRIFIGSGAAEPSLLVEGLVEHGTHLRGNEIVHLLTLGPAPYVAPGLQERFRHTAFFIGPNVREAVAEGRADFMSVFLSEIPELIYSRRVRVDTAVVQVSPPDARGFVSLGVSVDIVRAAVDSAAQILAEVNPHMPRTLGDSFLHVDQIDKLVPVDYPLPELGSAELDPVALRIGELVASLIPNGATLQMGIGRIPDATLAALSDRVDLGIHTEMFSDGVMALADGGVITGRRKTLLPGKMVTSFLMGSRSLYEWVHDNPMVEMRPTQFTNDPFTIARNERMVAINSALAVDLTGQVAADTVGGKFFSGIGGQVDFIRGAARSRYGKPVIALPSTAKGGSLSRIQAAFEEGAGVVTSRGDVHYVVTEFGIASLWGRSIRQRAMALIDIAHPDFRAELLAKAKGRRFVFPDQPVPRQARAWEEPCSYTLTGGRRLVVRPVKPVDHDTLQGLLAGIADEMLVERFFEGVSLRAGQKPVRLEDVDGDLHMALVAHVVEAEGADAYVGIARYDVDRATRMADAVVGVAPGHQRQGLGTLLLKRLYDIAKARGFSGLKSTVAADNKPMLTLVYNSGLPFKGQLNGDRYDFKISCDATDEARTRTGHP